MKKLRILAAADMHGDTKAVKKLAEKAEKSNADMVVICGDLTFFDVETKGMIGPFLEKGRQVAFVAGNHDSPATAEFLAEKYKIRNLQEYSFIINDVGFFGCGGANIGPNEISEKDISYYLNRNFNYVKKAKKKIMVTHIHPEGSISGAYIGSASVRKAIEKFQPDMHLCGHLHETEGAEEKIGKTRVINVGIKGKIIEI